ncbi:TM0106 family RecB-like putative nuclease [Mycobacterium sp. DBP42]|uniref:TM0106 family RecB-like putative nuclease n=1 Tax=Mycobacterium sp. DBP42 TaxID=2545267 RepID=UPI00110CE6B9|nr:TM0106 family RecB-like putative nuclease [Mycobacterium sp. DBP42]TMS54796.1 TM0106 family RecB-like putative nuclease [Mycobacterium sp. DBP42]
MREHLLTPSKITAWLDCPHYLTLRHQVDEGLLPQPKSMFGSFAQLLLSKGEEHEKECLAHYRSDGKSVLDVPGRRDGEAFADWVARSGNLFGENWDVVYQMPFMHDGVRGIADFVVQVQDPTTGAVSYEPVDAKLARSDAKPGHVLQLCFYADAIEAQTGVRPEHMYVWLGSGHLEKLRVDDFSPYWRRLRTQLTTALAAGPIAGTTPQPCAHCDFCEFQESCVQQWRDDDALHFVAGIRQSDIAALADVDVRTLADLASRTDSVEGMREQRLQRVAQQAALQVQARLQDGVPPYRVVPPGDDPQWGRGFETLPKPDDGDVFIDFEGHPFWRADTGLFFLFGLLERNTDGQWQYRTWWAHNQDEEATATAQFIDYLAERRGQFPDMHAYHYNHTERSSLVSLSQSYGVAEPALTRLVETGYFVDLLLVARNSIQAGTESYGLKALEQLTGFQRSHEIDKGAGAVLQYERFMSDGDRADLDAIAIYNEDDVLATMALRDWLIEQRPPDIEWRSARIEFEEKHPEFNERIAQLHKFEVGSDEHFLGDLLGYWGREWSAYITPKVANLAGDASRLYEDREAITGLESVGLIDQFGAKGQLLLPAMRFTFPDQDVTSFPLTGSSVVFLDPDGMKRYAEIAQLDRNERVLDLKWNEGLQYLGHIPKSVVVHDWVQAQPKPEALSAFASQLLDGGHVNPATLALLRRDIPTFTTGGGPAGGTFTDVLADMTQWVTNLNASCAAIQGPPGTGKTYSSAHLIHALVRSGLRVGISANTHVAIDNVVKEVLKTFEELGSIGELRAVRKTPVDGTKTFAGVIRYGDNKVCARSEFNVVAGTTWLFASEAMRDAPVDVLLIDEAGQLSLADALAASTSARNLVLLGDPLQLPQVAQAVHPHDSGRSVLNHILGEAVTMPDNRGAFLSETRRMHPDVCGFISDQIYEGRLSSHPNCGQQSTIAGTGLRWLRAGHVGCSTASVEEADLIADEISRLIGTPWTDFDGNQSPLAVNDFMVVAPYNDQVRTIRERLDSSDRTRGVPVGTVDKFQPELGHLA